MSSSPPDVPGADLHPRRQSVRDELETCRMSEGGPASTPESDIYTVLLAIATLLVLIATVLLAVRSQQFFGTWLPFGGA